MAARSTALIFNIGETPCPVKECDHFAELLSRWLQPLEMKIEVINAFDPGGPAFPPTVVVLRIGMITPRPDPVPFLDKVRRTCPNVPILGFYCSRQVGHSHIVAALRNGLDD